MNAFASESSFSSFSAEPSLRCDVGFYTSRQLVSSDNKIWFKELFEILPTESVVLDDLEDFLYVEIGNVDSYENITPVPLNSSSRDVSSERYFKKIQRGDIFSAECNDILLSKVRPALNKVILIDELSSNYFYTTAFIRIRPRQHVELMFYMLRYRFNALLQAYSRQGKGYPTLAETDLQYISFPRNVICEYYSRENTLLQQISQVKRDIADRALKLVSEQSIIDSFFEKELGLKSPMQIAPDGDLSGIVSFKSLGQSDDLRFDYKFQRESRILMLDHINKLGSIRLQLCLSEPMICGVSISPVDYDDDASSKYASMATISNWIYNDEIASGVSDIYFEKQADFRVRKNDILMARSGEGTIGKCALFDEDVSAVHSDFVIRIRTNEDYSPMFLYYYMRTSFFQFLVYCYKKGMSNTTNIFPAQLKNLPVILLPIGKQRSLASKLDTLIKGQRLLRAEICELHDSLKRFFC